MLFKISLDHLNLSQHIWKEVHGVWRNKQYRSYSAGIIDRSSSSAITKFIEPHVGSVIAIILWGSHDDSVTVTVASRPHDDSVTVTVALRPHDDSVTVTVASATTRWLRYSRCPLKDHMLATLQPFISTDCCFNRCCSMHSWRLMESCIWWIHQNDMTFFGWFECIKIDANLLHFHWKCSWNVLEYSEISWDDVRWCEMKWDEVNLFWKASRWHPIPSLDS